MLSSGGMLSLRSRSSFCTKAVTLLPAMGMLLMRDPTTKPSTTGTTWLTPSPQSNTTPVSGCALPCLGGSNGAPLSCVHGARVASLAALG